MTEPFNNYYIPAFTITITVGDRTFARGATRPYWTLGRKDSRALDARPVGH